jgi:hypothetical protein
MKQFHALRCCKVLSGPQEGYRAQRSRHPVSAGRI